MRAAPQNLRNTSASFEMKNLFHTATRFLPFALRRAITRLPERAAMRFRNPCVRARFTLDG